MRRAILLVLCPLLFAILSGCGGGGGSAPSQAAYTVEKLSSPYSGAMINGDGQILTTQLDQSDQVSAVLILNPNGTTTQLSPDVPTLAHFLGFSNSGYITGQVGMDNFRWGPAGASQQLEEPDGIPGRQNYCPYAVNSHGIVVGVKLVGQSAVPARWDAAGKATLLALPAGYDAGQARDVNDSGIIVGYVTKPEDISRAHPQAVVWDQDGTVRLLALDEAGSNQALLINNSGEIAGLSNERGVVWGLDGHVRRQLQTVSGYDPKPGLRDMNDSGLIVGGVYRNQGETTKAIVWDLNGDAQSLPALPAGSDTDAWGISNSGVIVGGCRVMSEPFSGTVIWTPG